jgi:hypothetical protein
LRLYGEDFYYHIDVEYPVATQYPNFEVKDNKVGRRRLTLSTPR